jgi:hypothetical protein
LKSLEKLVGTQRNVVTFLIELAAKLHPLPTGHLRKPPLPSCTTAHTLPLPTAASCSLEEAPRAACGVWLGHFSFNQRLEFVVRLKAAYGPGFQDLSVLQGFLRGQPWMQTVELWR